MEKVVVTGMGVISPIGSNVEQFWNSLVEGKSGISHIDIFDTSRFKTKIAGLVRDFDPEARFGRKEARRMDRFCQFAIAAADEALADAGLRLDDCDRERIGVYVGSGIGGVQTLLDQYDTLRSRGPERVSPTLVPMLISNIAAAMISIKYGLYGPTMSPVTACSIGNTSIGEAYRLIQSGKAAVVIAGGTEAAINEVSLASFSN
ncbi:beta-ketoacyl-[acyl-carrier-protein] synthase II, partial [Mesorhizobium sp. M00.F.Ca.ET.186.01.1.1]